MSYLTKELKQYYLKEYQRVVSFPDSYGEIEKKAIEIMDKFNASPHVNTLFYSMGSHKMKSDKGRGYDIFSMSKSWIQIAYSKTIEEWLSATLSKWKRETDLKLFPDSSTSFEKYIPVVIDKEDIEDSEYGYLNNPNYFNIYNYHIDLVNPWKDSEHKIFWDQLEKLAEIINNFKE